MTGHGVSTRAFPFWHSLHRLLCSRSRGAARRVRGAAGGMEVRAGWGRGSPADVGNLISGSSAFSKASLNVWKFTVHVLLKLGLENFEHYFTSV